MSMYSMVRSPAHIVRTPSVVYAALIGLGFSACSTGVAPGSDHDGDFVLGQVDDTGQPGDPELTQSGTGGGSASSAGVDASSDGSQEGDAEAGEGEDNLTNATCEDGILNQGEEGIDCGGPCDKSCNTDECMDDEDCPSGVCDMGSCVEASCEDGRLNGTESDVDCGGDCGPCDDGDQCSGDNDCRSQVCEEGVCIAADCLEDEDCADLSDACNVGRCDPESYTCAAAPTNDGMACGQAKPCVDGQVCDAGRCLSGTPRDCSHLDDGCNEGRCDAALDRCVADSKLLFFEDFHLPAGQDTEWTVNNGSSSWEYGSARQGSACSGSYDPSFDHTESSDNSIMGAILGGCTNSAYTTSDCLISPEIDTRNLAPGDELSLWRWLNSPGSPTVDDAVLFTNPRTGQWDIMFEMFPNQVADRSWTEMTFPMDGYAMPDFQVIVCFRVNSNFNPFMAGWNVDDIKIGPPSCEPWRAEFQGRD